MKEALQAVVKNTLETAFAKSTLRSEQFGDIAFGVPKLAGHGDFSTNVAMTIAISQKMAPRKIAEAIVQDYSACWRRRRW